MSEKIAILKVVFKYCPTNTHLMAQSHYELEVPQRFKWVADGRAKEPNKNLWKAMTFGFPSFSSFVKFCIGKSLSFYFLKNWWVGNKPLRELFPRCLIFQLRSFILWLLCYWGFDPSAFLSLGLSCDSFGRGTLDFAGVLSIL